MPKKKKLNIVYSTNPDFAYEAEKEDEISIPFNQQKLYVSIDRKNRGGKEVTLIENYIGTDQDAKDLAKQLKQHCGVGGGFKDNEIYIQGNHREKVVAFLQKLGAVVKLKGG